MNDTELVTSERALSLRDQQNPLANAASVNEILGQVALIQQVMGAVMKEGEHFGKIPGCGDKPALLKPGAEKLGFTFRLAPEFAEVGIDMGNGHREYRIKCSLFTINGHNFVGQGVGSCSTMEGKFRYRTGPKKTTGKPVPKEYWTLRQSEPAKAQAMLGGKGFVTAKNDAGVWEIAEQGERVEHDNPADYYNTVLKMAKKRAHVDAILTATAASDIFAQDIDEMVADGLITAQPVRQAQSNGKTTAASGVDQEIAKIVGELEDLCRADGFNRGVLEEYLREIPIGESVLLNSGQYLWHLPAQRLEWFKAQWKIVSGNVLTWREQKGENELPGMAQEQADNADEAEVRERIAKALEKRTEGQLVAEGVLVNLSEKPTKKAGGKRYGILLDGDRWFNHFSHTTQENAETLKGCKVRIHYEKTQYGNDLKSIDPIA